MKIVFLMPGYVWAPSGGYRVVCEYANRLVSRGHQVTVVHPRHLKLPVPPEKLSAYRRARQIVEGLRNLFAKPSTDWQPIDRRVKLLFVPNLDSRHIPDGDAIFATAWGTVQSVLECPQTKGEKFYLIQHYETWQGPKDLVDATWRSPLHKVVISKWLFDLGKELGSEDITYIPNAVNHELYQLTQPIESRPRRVAMMFSTVQFKGSVDGIEALRIARERYPDLQAVFFGLNLLRPPIIPEWIEYHRNPPQNLIVNEIYNKSCIFLAPSLTEGSPLPPAEAACCGCALVATDIGGFREYIQNGVTGLLSPPKDPKALAENLCLLLGNDELRVRLAKAGNSFMELFDWERSADLLENFLIRVVQGKRSVQQGFAASSPLSMDR
jgi:glycosyltransferase involved in cell wall biosynthesis